MATDHGECNTNGLFVCLVGKDTITERRTIISCVIVRPRSSGFLLAILILASVSFVMISALCEDEKDKIAFRFDLKNMKKKQPTSNTKFNLFSK